LIDAFGAPIDERSSTPAPETRWIASSVLVLGLLSLALLFATRSIDRRLIRRDDALLRSLGEIRLALATTHLWVEEYVTGDAVEPELIDRELLRAERAVQAMLASRDDVQLAARVGPFRDEIGTFRRISEQRQHGYAHGEDVGIGSVIDVVYDALFRELFAASAALQEELEARQRIHRRHAEVLLRTIVITWIAVVVLAFVVLVRLQRRRATEERALRERRERLFQAQKMEALGRLAGGIAHDINNYLGAIRGHGELLETVDLSRERVRSKVEAIVRVVDKASALIEQLLAFTRRQPVRPRVLRLDDTLEGGIIALGGRLLGPDYELVLERDGATWPILIDPSQLDQVLINLLVNARDAMPSGGRIRIAIENRNVPAGAPLVLRAPGPGDYVALTVEDHGMGIAIEDQERIFEPFFSTKDRAGSSGLGLSTVYGILQQAGGGIAVDSTVGRGSRLTVLLPRFAGEATPEPASQVASAGPGADAEAGWQGRTALLVDDHSEMRRTTRAMLEALGWRVREAASGEQALALAADGPLDLIVTDIVMEGMGGRELAERLIGVRPAVPVLFVSGYADDAALRAMAARGDLELLRKPFSRAELSERIEAVLRAGKQA
jgi:signal transduction histidine kinase/CheY-like chemotaxis protein